MHFNPRETEQRARATEREREREREREEGFRCLAECICVPDPLSVSHYRIRWRGGGGREGREPYQPDNRGVGSAAIFHEDRGGLETVARASGCGPRAGTGVCFKPI